MANVPNPERAPGVRDLRAGLGIQVEQCRRLKEGLADDIPGRQCPRRSPLMQLQLKHP